MHGGVMDVFGIKDVRVTRCGYTGEDGFEVRTSLHSGKKRGILPVHKLMSFTDPKTLKIFHPERNVA